MWLTVNRFPGTRKFLKFVSVRLRSRFERNSENISLVLQELMRLHATLFHHSLSLIARSGFFFSWNKLTPCSVGQCLVRRVWWCCEETSAGCCSQRMSLDFWCIILFSWNCPIRALAARTGRATVSRKHFLIYAAKRFQSDVHCRSRDKRVWKRRWRRMKGRREREGEGGWCLQKSSRHQPEFALLMQLKR